MSISTLEAEAKRGTATSHQPVAMPDANQPTMTDEDRRALGAIFLIMIGIFVAAGVLYSAIALLAK
jgi:uncharacterized membrane protein